MSHSASTDDIYNRPSNRGRTGNTHPVAIARAIATRSPGRTGVRSYNTARYIDRKAVSANLPHTS